MYHVQREKNTVVLFCIKDVISDYPDDTETMVLRLVCPDRKDIFSGLHTDPAHNHIPIGICFDVRDEHIPSDRHMVVKYLMTRAHHIMSANLVMHWDPSELDHEDVLAVLCERCPHLAWSGTDDFKIVSYTMGPEMHEMVPSPVNALPFDIIFQWTVDSSITP